MPRPHSRAGRPGPGTRPPRSGVPVRASSSVSVSSATISPSRTSSSRSQRCASSMTWLDTSKVAPASASRWNRFHRSRRSTGSRPTVGSSSTSSSGESSRATASDDPGQLAAGQLADHLVALVGEVDLLEHPVDVRARRPQDGGEVPQVLDHREVGVDRGSLGDVADPAAQRRAAGRQAEHLAGPGDHRLHPDDGPHQGGLAAAAGAEQPGDDAPADVEVQSVQHLPGAADHPQAPYPYRDVVVHAHVDHSTPPRAPCQGPLGGPHVSLIAVRGQTLPQPGGL